MGEVVPARTSPTLADLTSPIPSHCASIVATSTIRVNNFIAYIVMQRIIGTGENNVTVTPDCFDYWFITHFILFWNHWFDGCVV